MMLGELIRRRIRVVALGHLQGVGLTVLVATLFICVGNTAI